MVVHSARNVDILDKVVIPLDTQIGYPCPGDWHLQILRAALLVSPNMSALQVVIHWRLLW